MVRRIVHGLRSIGWFVAAAAAASMASERVYWYWAGIGVESVTVLAAFYAFAIAVAFAVLATVPTSGWRAVVIGGALYALVVEGIITPVIYEDGPLPVLYLMFVGWHGLLAFAGFVVLVRRWAVLRRWQALSAASAVAGVGWGCWALASAVTDRTTAEAAALDGGSSAVLEPGDFATYTFWVTVVVVVSHLVLDRLWPTPGWRISRAGVVSTGLACGALALLLVLPAVPWAPIKLVAIGWLLWRLRRRHADDTGPTVIDELAGRVLARHLLPLVAMPLAASCTYAALWAARGHAAMRFVYVSVIGVQIATGTAALVASSRRPRPAIPRCGDPRDVDMSETS